MKILAELKSNNEQVYIINTFNSVSTNIHVPVEVCTVLYQNGELENLPFKCVKVIDEEYKLKGE